jgi:hypothetical protein
MTSRNAARIVLVCSLALSVGIAGCEKKKKKPPAPPPAPVVAPAPPPPDPVDIQGLMTAMKPDARVHFIDAAAPADRSLAEATINFASALAKGDKNALKGMLSTAARQVLDTLAADGTFEEETAKIEQVRVVQIDPTDELDLSNATILLAVQAPDRAYPLAWRASKSGGDWKFTGMASEATEKRRASDFDNASIALGVIRAPEPAAELDVEPDATTARGERPGSPATPGSSPDGIRKNTPAGPITIPTGPGGKPGGTPVGPGGS